MNTKTLQANMLRGVRLLDEVDPLWWNGNNTPPAIKGMVGHIDIETLDMADPQACILGKRHQNQFGGGKAILGLTCDEVFSHGFDVDYQRGKVSRLAWISQLTELWAAVIQSRRFPRRKIARDPFVIRANETWVREYL